MLRYNPDKGNFIIVPSVEISNKLEDTNKLIADTKALALKTSQTADQWSNSLIRQYLGILPKLFMQPSLRTTCNFAFKHVVHRNIPRLPRN